MSCIRCKQDCDNYNNTKTCDACINYIGEKFVCKWCNGEYTRTNKSPHNRSFRCISKHDKLYVQFKQELNVCIEEY